MKSDNHRPLHERFWSKVKRGAPNECWPWQEGRNEQGYGRFKIGRLNHGAHRVAYLLTTGADPGKEDVLHSCDNPPCCNPAHLSLGDDKRNAAERDARGRAASHAGSHNGRAVLTEETATYAMARLLTGRERQVDIARAFGSSQARISGLWLLKTWRHLWFDGYESR
jgi:hypothetical protein